MKERVNVKMDSSFQLNTIKLGLYIVYIYIKWSFSVDFVYLFDLILYIPVNIFSVMSGQVILG